MAEFRFQRRTTRRHKLTALFVLPWAVSLSAQPNSQLVEQQRREQAQARRALEESEQRIARSQAEQIRAAQERSEQQRRAFAEANRRREAQQHYEEWLIQTRAQQSTTPEPQNEGNPSQILPPEAVAPPLSAANMSEARPSRQLMRLTGLVLMIGAAIGGLFVLSRIMRERLAP